MKLPQLLLVLLLSIAAGAASALYVSRHQGTAVATTESSYDRVLRTGTLRCGYADWPPYVFMKDPTTGKMSGIMADLTEAIAGKLNLKVEWTENTGWGSFIESLRDHRIDVMCAGIWRNGERGRYLGYGLPMFYSPVYSYVSVDEHRFDKDYSAVDNPGTRIATMDGEMSDVIAKRFFPKATEVSVPQLGQITDILSNVADHKADIAFNEPSFVNEFMKKNPGKLRRAQDAPFQYFPTSLAVEIHEVQLRDMLDSALVELQNQGAVEEIIAKYNPDPSVFLRTAPPYKQP